MRPREEFPTWDEIKQSILLRRRIPRFQVWDERLRCNRVCIVSRCSPLKGYGILLWVKPEVPTKPEVSWVEDGQVHTLNVEEFGPFAFSRKGSMNSPLVLPRGIKPLNEAAWDFIHQQTAKAFGARYQWKDRYSGHWGFSR